MPFMQNRCIRWKQSKSHKHKVKGLERNVSSIKFIPQLEKEATWVPSRDSEYVGFLKIKTIL